MKLTALLRTVSALPISIRPLQHRSFQPDFVPRDPKTEPKKYRYPAYYDPYGPAPPPSDKILQLADRIQGLPDDERKQLFAALRARLELPEAVMFKGSGTAAGAEAECDAQKGEKMEEKTAYDVKLERFDGAAKLKVVKEVREFTKLGLKESKELVEKAPAVLKKGVSKEEAEGIIDRIKAAGGVAVME